MARRELAPLPIAPVRREEMLHSITRHEARILAFTAASDPSMIRAAREFHRDYSEAIVSTGIVRWAERRNQDVPTARRVAAQTLFERDHRLAQNASPADRSQLLTREWRDIVAINEELDGR